MIRPAAIGFVTAITVALTPAVTQALTISSAGGTITIQAAAGEANSISVAASGANWRFADTGSNLDGTPVVATAGGLCVQAAANVDCPMAGVTNAVANLTDRRDVLSLAAFVGVAVNADGGEGSDTIFSAGGNDTVAGGSGPDTILGGAGNDSLSGGPGSDLMLGETVAARRDRRRGGGQRHD
jgi:Ca2+-binding RTX toxin-like protein